MAHWTPTSDTMPILKLRNRRRRSVEQGRIVGARTSRITHGRRRPIPVLEMLDGQSQ